MPQPPSQVSELAPPQQPPAPPPPQQPQPEQQPPAPQPSPQQGQPESPAEPQLAGTIELNSVTFEQLRAQGLSVTQATRLLAHRERVGRFQSVDEIDEIAGFPREFAEDLKRRSAI